MEDEKLKRIDRHVWHCLDGLFYVFYPCDKTGDEQRIGFRHYSEALKFALANLDPEHEAAK